jgi:NarL family two-component system response regulator LiaR
VVFSWNLQADAVAGALEAGAVGYVSKGLSAAELVETLERIHAGEQVTPLSTSMPEGDDFGRWPGDEHGISARESEVLALICQGLDNQTIAEQIFLSLNTVKTYVRTLYRKIQVESRTQAVLWGLAHGFGPDRARHTDERR